MDWLELLAVQGTLKSLLQHQGNSKFNIHLHYHLHIFFAFSISAEQKSDSHNLVEEDSD